MKTKIHRLAWVLGLVSLIAVIASGSAATPASPPGGLFVIGDGNAVVDTHVTFWGAQWWKDNTISGGVAPPSFKGFAGIVAPNCLGFTTETGNSVPPPDGPLPASITVLVTTSVQQTGSVVSGTVLEMAQVQTDAGYDSNPGHAGTGTVTAIIPCPGE